MTLYQVAFESLEDRTRQISQKIKRFEARKIRIRSEIERYFGDEGEQA
jgi:hypothetical protein